MEFPSCLEVQAGKEGQHELKQVDIAEMKNRPSVFSFPEVCSFTTCNSNPYRVFSQGSSFEVFDHPNCLIFESSLSRIASSGKRYF